MQEGQYTRTIYTLIRNTQYGKAVELLERVLQALPRKRAALSLLGHCQVQLGYYESAQQTYETLVRYHPGFGMYRLYHAQALYKAGNLEEAGRVLAVVPGYVDEVRQLKLAIAYSSDQMHDFRSVLSDCSSQSASTMQNLACALYKEGKYSEALQKFGEAMDVLGEAPSLLYSSALCNYQLQRHGEALKYLALIIERGVRSHEDLQVGIVTRGEDACSVGNSQALHDSALVEAFNLKAAIELRLRNDSAAKEALTDMPPRDVHELDPCTLHNRALVYMRDDPEDSFRTFNFLLANPPFPPETFTNLLLLYVRPPYSMHSQAADLMAEYPAYTQQLLPADVAAFLDAAIMRQHSPEEAYAQFERIARDHVDALRLRNKLIQDARRGGSTSQLTARIQEFDQELERYMPALMAQAHIFWESGHFSEVLRVLHQSREFASEHESWKLNVAHAHFMMETPAGASDAAPGNYEKAIQHLKPLVDSYSARQRLLDLAAMVVANLCVCYVMCEQNHEAERLMKQLELEEEAARTERPPRSVHHLCIVNLVVGTLYCAKHNFDFGISRVIKALEPLDRNLEPDTWFYSKRCLLALADNLAKHILTINDATLDEVVTFLTRVQKEGKDVASTHQGMTVPASTVRAEAAEIQNVLQQIVTA